MAEKNWVIAVDEKLKNMVDTSTESEHWNKRSIYKVPACITDLNKKAYRPQAVSFGPYHHGEENLMPMEEHKQRALLRFIKRSGKPIEVFVKALAEVVQDLKDSYNPLDPKWEKDTEFLQLMILDGCFMLEILRTATHALDDYAPNDPIFSSHGKLYIIPFIMRDMLMLENQLPMLVLDKLVAVESGNTREEEFVNKLILKFWSITPVSGMRKCLHVLDVYRKSLIQVKPQQKGRPRRPWRPKHEGHNDIIRSATELDEAGIRFKKCKSGSLTDITFQGGVLRLPMTVVDDTTESTFLNLMAFERSHVGAGNEVTAYIFFMDNIIDNERDVALLHSRGIIKNTIGSDKAVAKLFNSLSKDITLDPESTLDAVRKDVNRYCKKRWNEWRANLIHTYFRNPWALLSLFAAVFLFALTIVQTVYAIYPYYHSQSPSSPPMVSQSPIPAYPPSVSPKPSPPPKASPKPNPPHH